MVEACLMDLGMDWVGVADSAHPNLSLPYLTLPHYSGTALTHRSHPNPCPLHTLDTFSYTWTNTNVHLDRRHEIEWSLRYVKHSI